MSGLDKTIVKVSDLVIGINNEDNKNDFRFKLDFGSFEIERGDLVLVKGGNGFGKSTFLRMFRLQSYDYFVVTGGGMYFIEKDFPNDKSINEYSEELLTRLNRNVSYIGQEDVFMTADSAYSYIFNTCKLALEDLALSAKERKEKLSEIDDMILEYYNKYLEKSFMCKNYKTFKNKNVRGWSGGQKKMINVLAGVIKAKVCGLKLVVFDEPLNNLDVRNKVIMNELVKELLKNDIAIIAITHCQIFEGVKKVITIGECENGVRKAKLEVRTEDHHHECLKDYTDL